MAKCIVYFMRMQVPEATCPIKIGRTTNTETLVRRVKTIAEHLPYPLELMGIITGARADAESRLHEKFRHLRFRGEWFYPGVDLIRYIEEYAEPFETKAGYKQASVLPCDVWNRRDLMYRIKNF
jgi:hypothetical protein